VDTKILFYYTKGTKQIKKKFQKEHRYNFSGKIHAISNLFFLMVVLRARRIMSVIS
jgi:hypothetical protein